MIRKQEGFSMVELLITMVIFVLTIAAASAIFVPLLTQFKQQSKMAETQIEGIVGLETLRRDIEQAGYGLPWAIPTTGVPSYQEPTSSPANITYDVNWYNDAQPNPPKAIVSGDGAVDNPQISTSDYLVIKSTIIGTKDAAPKWTYIVGKGDGSGNVKCWNAACDSPDDFNASDRVIALIPSRGSSDTSQRILVVGGGAYSVQFGSKGGTVAAKATGFSPALQNDKYLIYGVDSDSDLKIPFNRADYYIKTDTSTPPYIPQRCAAYTGLLVKSVFSHKDGKLGPGIPLMDCVADMEIVYGVDQNNNGNISYFADLSLIPAVLSETKDQTIRDQLKEVHVYILAHEGQKDANYDASTLYKDGKVPVGEFGLGNNFDLTKITDWKMYRWKIYTLVVRPKNLL